MKDSPIAIEFNTMTQNTFPYRAGGVCALALLLLVGVLPAPATVTNVAWYRLGENDPGAASGQLVKTTTVDVMGVNNLKRFGTPVYTSDVASGAAAQMRSSLAVTFNGTSEFYSNAVATTARNNFGLEAWVEVTSFAPGTYVVAHNGNTAANGWGIVAEVGTHSVTYHGFFGGGGGLTFGARVANSATHVAIVRDGGTCTLYVNGVASGSTNITPVLPAGGFTIAASTPSPQSLLFPGTIDEVRVFTFAAGQFSTSDLQKFQQLVATLPATGITRTNATLNGSAGSFEFPTTVWFEYGTTTNFGTVTPPQDLGSGFTATNFSEPISGLSLGDTYYFRAVSSNQLGVAYAIPESFTTIGFLEGLGFALSFNGAGDYVQVPADPRLDAFPLVVTAWINTTQATGEVGIVNKYLAGSLNGWQIALVNGEVRAWYIRSAANYVWDGGLGLNGGSVTNGEWHHVAFTVDGGGGALYVDGFLKDFMNWTGTPGSCTTVQPMSFARYPGGAGEFFRGRMDEVAIWQFVSQTQGDILTNMNRGLLGTENGILAYYRLNEGTSVVANNSAATSGDLTDGFISGATWVPGLALRPAILSKTPTGITRNSATFKGVANPGLTNTAAWFEWGLTTDYGNATPPQPLGKGPGNTNFSQTVTGLTENVTYHYRAVASNNLGASFGSDKSFVTTGTNLITPRAYHTATVLPNGKVLVAGGLDDDGNALSSVELFDPGTGVWSPAGSMMTNRYSHTATVLPNGKVLVAGGQGNYPAFFASAELYDPATGAWTATGSMATNRYGHTASLLASGKVLVSAGSSSFGTSGTAELYDPVTETWTPTGSLLTGRHYHTATVLSGGKVLVAGGIGTNNSTLASAELYDPVSGTWTNTGSMTTNRYLHTATLLFTGKVLVVGGINLSPIAYFNSSELYDPSSGTWTATGSMLNYRYQHTATLLPNGRVFAAGLGIGVPSLYDPLTATWADVSGPDPLAAATATLLPNGNVLVAGGSFGTPVHDAEVYINTNNGSWTATGSLANGRYDHTATMLPDARVLVAGFTNAEIYNATTGAWTNTAVLNTQRSGHRATLLGIGKVLVSGGYQGSIAGLASAELYDPTAGTWANTGSMNTLRGSHSATLLTSGKVLVAGGLTNTLFGPIALVSAELYDPTAQTWAFTGPMSTNRVGHTATRLLNGKVLVTGGAHDTSSGALASCEIFDPATGTWTITGSMTTNRSGHTATLLSDGTVLVAGGTVSGFLNSLSSAEIYDPATGTWTQTAPMNGARASHTATLLPNGKVLVARGYNLGYLSSAELYDPLLQTWTVTATTGAATLSPTANFLGNGKVLLVGGWTGNGGTNRAELYDIGLGFIPLFQAQVLTTTSPVSFGGSFTLTGTQFRGFSEASGGNGSANSDANFPLVQLRNLENEFTSFVLGTNWSTTSFQSGPLTGLQPGWTMATVFADAIPSRSSGLFNLLRPTATVTVSNLLQVFDGTAKSVSVATVPPGLAVNVSYNGSPNAPTNVGSYAVVAAIADPIYDSVPATNTLVIVVPRDFGVDVSHFQAEGGIAQSAWNQMVTEGKRFVFVKATEGLTGPHDGAMSNNVARATAAGLLVGVYHFAHPENRPTPGGAALEASNLVVYAGTAIGPGRLRPVLDLESGAATLGTTELTDWAIAFSDEIIARRGPAAAPIIYCSQTFANNELDSRLAGYDLWLRTVGSGADPVFENPPPQGAFATATGVFNNWSFWQYTDTGTSGGISPLDLDVCHSDYKPLASFVITNATPAPIQLTGTILTPNGAFQFSFTNVPGVAFTVLATTDPTLPLTNWTILGPATQIAPGQFQFTDPQATNNEQRFYTVRWP